MHFYSYSINYNKAFARAPILLTSVLQIHKIFCCGASYWSRLKRECASERAICVKFIELSIIKILSERLALRLITRLIVMSNDCNEMTQRCRDAQVHFYTCERKEKEREKRRKEKSFHAFNQIKFK